MFTTIGTNGNPCADLKSITESLEGFFGADWRFSNLPEFQRTRLLAHLHSCKTCQEHEDVPEDPTKIKRATPLGDVVLILPDEAPTEAHGLLLPTAEQPPTGTVAAVGDRSRFAVGDPVDVEAKIEAYRARNGEMPPLAPVAATYRHNAKVILHRRVMYRKYTGTEIEIDGVKHLIVRDADVLAVLD